MQLLEQFNISTGVVQFQYPSKMTAEDLQDIEDKVALLIRALRRRHASVATLDREPGLSDETAGRVPDR